MSRHFVPAFALAALTLALVPVSAHAQDESRTVANGGIHVDGWTGVIDAREAERGYSLDGARLAGTADELHVTTGPAVTYWNPANRLTGDYTVSATFREDEYMSLNNHPHPYGIVIAGNDLGTDGQSLLYCAAYGNGRFIMRGFGPASFQLNGRGEEHAAINRAAEVGASVTQQIAVSVRGGRVECAINGTVVGSYDRGDVVADGRLRSTDGVYGIRFGHNTDAVVTGLSVTRH
ncbi:hypothetical protein BH23GEM10_BH23GEM10_11160 [soil metagenome]